MASMLLYFVRTRVLDVLNQRMYVCLCARDSLRLCVPGSAIVAYILVNRFSDYAADSLHRFGYMVMVSVAQHIPRTLA